MTRTARPFERKEEHRECATHRYKPTAVIVFRKLNVKQVKERIHKRLIVPQPFLLEFGDDATARQKMMNPDHDADDEKHRLEPERRINCMRDDDHRNETVREEMVNCPNNLGSLFLIGFPKHHGIDRPFRPFEGGRLHCKTAVF